MAAGCGEAPQRAVGPEQVVRAFFEAYEEGDAPEVLALLDDDFVFRGGDAGFTVPREAMPDVLAWDIAAASRVEIDRLAAAGDTVRVRLRERNRFTELLGLAPWVVEATFVVRDERIVEEVAREVGEGRPFTERFRRALAPVIAWAEESRPEEAAATFHDGAVARYDGATARRLLRLIRDWRAASDRPRSAGR